MGNTKYRIKKKSNAVNKYTGTPSEPPLIGKGKILLMLIFGTLAVAGIYMTALHLHFMPIMPIYWVITGILLMVFIYLKMKYEYLYTKIISEGTPSSKQKDDHRKRMKRLKYLLIALLPFMFTLIGDLVYLYLLKDLDIIGAISDLIK